MCNLSMCVHQARLFLERIIQLLRKNSRSYSSREFEIDFNWFNTFYHNIMA